MRSAWATWGSTRSEDLGHSNLIHFESDGYAAAIDSRSDGLAIVE